MRFTYAGADGRQIQGSLKDGSFAMMLYGGETVLTCDDEGRPWTIWQRFRTLRRSYSGRVMEVWRDRRGARQRRPVGVSEWLARWEQVRRMLRADLGGPLRSHPEVAERVERAVRHGPDRLERDAQRYRSLYSAISILPPDAYLDVVLQLVLGCPYNRCSFCDFYREIPFRVRSIPEFSEHTSQVVAYLGRALPMRKGVFLADADALAAPDETLLSALDVVAAHFPTRPVSAFTSPFTRHRRSVEVYQEARARHLHRVHIGMESGSEAVLKILGKPVRPDRTLELVEKLKAGGLSVGVILLVGAGGERLAEEHVAESIARVREMRLGPEDVVYLSEIVIEGRSPYLERLAKAGSTPLDEEALARQSASFRERLRTKAGGPRVARYDIRDHLP